MKKTAQVAHSDSGLVRKQVADAMPNNKALAPRFAFVVLHFYSPPANVLRRSGGIKGTATTELKRIMILNFHFVPIRPRT